MTENEEMAKNKMVYFPQCWSYICTAFKSPQWIFFIEENHILLTIYVQSLWYTTVVHLQIKLVDLPQLTSGKRISEYLQSGNWPPD